MSQIRIGTIFGQHQFLIGIVFFKLFHPWLDVLYLFLVPAKITVHTLYVCVQVDRMIHVTIPIDRNGVTVRIFCLGKIMERTGQCSCILMWLIYFIVKPPYINGRMIETLADQFAKLALRILSFVSGHPVHARYFGPNNQSQCITAGIKVVWLLVVGKTDSSGSHIHNGSQIEIVMFVFKGATQSPPILMTGHTIHRVLLSVQEKAFPGYYLILPHPERLHHFIDYFSVCHQPADNFIKIRIFTSLPEMWVL